MEPSAKTLPSSRDRFFFFFLGMITWVRGHNIVQIECRVPESGKRVGILFFL